MAGMSSRAADLKAAVDESLNQLAQAVDEQRASDEMRRYLDLMARFHRCSWGNCLLIEMGRPGATLVAGFSRWTRLGRSVKLGEKAIHILAPCPVEVEDKNGEIQERVFFKAACVFDVSQTEGEDLATYEVPDVTVSADQLLRNLERMARRITSSFIGTNGSLASCFVRTDIPTHCPQRPEPLAADAMGRGHVLDCLGLRVLGEQKLQDHPPGSEHERGGRPHLKPLLNPDWVELGRLLARRGQRAPPSPAPPTPPHP